MKKKYIKNHLISTFFLSNLKIIILISAFIFSCSGNSGDFNNKKSIFTIDTLMINSKDEIIYLKDNLSLSAIKQDSLFLYIFNRDLLRLETINLNDGQFKKYIQFEREGPNGIGDWHIGLISVKDSLLVLEGDNTFYFLNYSGDLLEKIRVDHLFYSVDILYNKFIFSGFYYFDNLICVIVIDRMTREFNLLVYDKINDKHKLFEIPFSEVSKSSSVIVKIEKSIFPLLPGFSISKFQDGIAISNRTYPQIVYYTDNYKNPVIIDLKSKFYNDVSPVEDIPEVYGEAEGEKFKIELEKRMNFLPPIWDNGGSRMVRWGYKRSNQNEDVETPEYDNYLFVTDSTFEMVREFRIPGIRIKPYRYFLIDNIIYLYHGFDDELGFLRIYLDNL